MPTQSQLDKIEAYINNAADNLDQIELTEAFKINTTPFAFQLNAFLRANLVTPTMEMYLSEIDDLITSMPLDEEITVYRACNYLEMLPTMMNDTYFHWGYMSTSLDEEVIFRFFNGDGYYIPAYLKIFLPKGVPALNLDQIPGVVNTTYEGEILVGRRAKFEITNNRVLTTANSIKGELGDIISKYKKMHYVEMSFIGYLPIF